MTQTVFVTGATGLLGNNLVRLLLAEGYAVRALARSAEKAQQQFSGMTSAKLEIITGDMTDVAGFASSLAGCSLLFHTAAHFRASYTGGNHSARLSAVNVDGTRELLTAAYDAGIRRMVHVSSIAVLGHNASGEVDENCLQHDPSSVDDYYRSKIASDAVIFEFLERRPDMHISLVLPGWMHGPGDIGPTSAGQFVLDFLHRRLPGVVDSISSMVDARDVAAVMLAAAHQGRRGERYLAAGRALPMVDLMRTMETLSGVPAPKRALPTWMVFMVAYMQEAYARLSGKPVLLSLAMARTITSDYGRRFSAAKIRQEFGLGFRPLEETLADEIAWYRQAGWVKAD